MTNVFGKALNHQLDRLSKGFRSSDSYGHLGIPRRENTFEHSEPRKNHGFLYVCPSTAC